jgi:hypothetical protein
MQVTTFNNASFVQQQSVVSAFFSNWADVMGVTDEEECLRQIQTKFNDKPNVIFICYHNNINNSVVTTGSIDIANFSGCSPMIGNIYTEPNYRHMGHGTKMLRYIETHLSKIGFVVAYLWCFPELETFYSTKGWYKIQDHVIIEKPAIIMAKNI